MTRPKRMLRPTERTRPTERAHARARDGTAQQTAHLARMRPRQAQNGAAAPTSPQQRLGQGRSALLAAHKRRQRTDPPGAVQCHLDGRHRRGGGQARAVCAAIFSLPDRFGERTCCAGDQPLAALRSSARRLLTRSAYVPACSVAVSRVGIRPRGLAHGVVVLPEAVRVLPAGSGMDSARVKRVQATSARAPGGGHPPGRDP